MRDLLGIDEHRLIQVAAHYDWAVQEGIPGIILRESEYDQGTG